MRLEPGRAVVRNPPAREPNRDYYLRRAHEELATANGCSCPDARERHRELARLLLSIAGDHEPGSTPPGMGRATAARLKPALVILPGSA